MTGKGATQFDVLISNAVPDVNLFTPTQTFPRYTYYEDKQTGEWHREDNITGFTLTHFRDTYQDNTITKDDIFDYVYGMLHAPDYRDAFATNLRLSLPRIPLPPISEPLPKQAQLWHICT